jgi:hypothetical protein
MEMFPVILVALVSLALLYPEFMENSVNIFMRYEDIPADSARMTKYGSLFYRIVGTGLAVIVSIVVYRIINFAVDRLGGAFGFIFHSGSEPVEESPENGRPHGWKLGDIYSRWRREALNRLKNQIERHRKKDKF